MPVNAVLFCARRVAQNIFFCNFCCSFARWANIYACSALPGRRTHAHAHAARSHEFMRALPCGFRPMRRRRAGISSHTRPSAPSIGTSTWHRAIDLSGPLLSSSRSCAAMAKSKNHTSHNQSNKAHKNGAWLRGAGMSRRVFAMSPAHAAAPWHALQRHTAADDHAPLRRHQEAQVVQVLLHQGGAPKAALLRRSLGDAGRTPHAAAAATRRRHGRTVSRLCLPRRQPPLAVAQGHRSLPALNSPRRVLTRRAPRRAHGRWSRSSCGTRCDRWRCDTAVCCPGCAASARDVRTP